MNALSPQQIKGYIQATIFGFVCGIIGQAIMKIYIALGLPPGYAVPLTVFTFALGGAILMGIGIYGRCFAFGGAGAMLPMSGLAGAVTGGIIEARAQGKPMKTAIWEGAKGPASVFIPVGLLAGLAVAIATIVAGIGG